MDTKIIIKNAFDPATITLSAGLVNARDLALSAAKSCQKIETAADLNAATQALAELKSLEKTIASAHAEAKKPFLAVSRRLDALKKDYAESLADEQLRLSRMIGAHQEAERKKAEAARRAAEEERRRIAYLAAEEERKRIAEETRRFNETGAGSGTLSADLEKIRQDAQAQAVESAQTAAQAATLAAKGTSVRRKWDFRVTDIVLLYKHRPDLVKLEPNKTAIKAILAATNGAEIPGLESWSETVAGVKSTAKSLSEIDACDY